MSQQANHHDHARTEQTPLWFAARASAFAALCAFGMQPLVASAQAALPIAPMAGAGPTVGTSAAGVPVVNIVAPNARGVSNNRFDQFNVGTAGVIVNNSVQGAQTQIGGAVQGNAMLGKQGANLVLFQVTSGAPSQLLGKTEIAGQGANFVLANPAGISCSGCGFLNAPRVTLATGTPNFNADGSLAGFDVTQGRISVNGAGLSASNSAVDLIARAMTINGQVQGRSIDAIAGANRVDYATSSVTRALQSTDEKPAVAIDVQALGSMYGNGAVRLIGTEAGVGVRDNGRITSLTGNINVSANGDVTIGAPATMQAGGDLSVRGANIANQGALDAQGVSLFADNTLTNSGKIDSTNFSAVGVQALTNRGTVSGSEGGTMGGNHIALDGGTVKSGGLLNVSGGDVSNRNGTLSSNGAMNVAVDNFDNTNGVLSAGADSTIRANRVLTNANGTIVANGSLMVAGDSLDNAGGKIDAGNGMLNVQLADGLSNAAGLVKANLVAIDAQHVDNTKGAIAADSSATVNAYGDVKNAGGSIVAGGGLSVTGQLDNTDGTLQTDRGSLTAYAPAIVNTRGRIVSGGNVDINVADLDTSGGEISAVGNGRVTAWNAVRNVGGTINAGQTLEINAASLDNRAGGAINADHGRVMATVSGALENSGGRISSGDLVALTTGTLDNDNGVISASNNVAINTRGPLSNRDGSITAGKSVGGFAGSIDNTGGTIYGPEGATIVTADAPTPSGPQPQPDVQPQPQPNPDWNPSAGLPDGYVALPDGRLVSKSEYAQWKDFAQQQSPSDDRYVTLPDGRLVEKSEVGIQPTPVDYSNREAQPARLMNSGVATPQPYGVNAYTVMNGV
ncbi:filamentous hemagglutinin N-terminal domain-containing protein [Paraburkholderia rhizosphaerae]|uniref:Filamentous hemagglutinin n=1 Tax=Paraburkholderia rhizosphaerae TaxID=480658 RepID=A0A4V6QCV1_9BURK|nr:filamentous hemagglutinin N-terminal domain-containing protein [Paraburkholderia rhizosphaerae]TDY37744.1 filamentous hemagglutinin [Paraburkholderia rhizosphaerae]